MKKSAYIILIILVYGVTTLFSYVAFSKASSPIDAGSAGQAQKTNDYQAMVFNQNAKKDKECPLNGALYSNDQKNWWEKHRPLGVMIENSLDARPQSGINAADITYEAVAEGGITRTLNVYYCQDAGIVGPVRSARTYFVDFISEYGKSPLYAHVGGANTPGPADALGQIGDYGWNNYNDLNQFSIGFPTYWRDENRLGHEVATEHTMYSSTSKLWAVGEQRGLTNKDKDGNAWDDGFVKYTFKDDAALAQRPATQTIHVDFWNGDDYAVDWIYRQNSNDYARKNGGVAHMDRNTNQQLTAKNIVVLFMRESHANDGYEDNAHMLYGDKGSGQALIFQDGKEIKGTWKKADRESRTIIEDTSGNEIAFTRGKIWFEIQPLNADIMVK